MSPPVRNRAFNPEMLALARQSRGLSQRELAEASGLTQGAVSKLENGLVEPARESVAALARALDYPVEFFHRTERVVGLPASFTRKRERLPKRTFDRIHAELNLRRMNVALLLRSVQVDATRELPLLDIDEHGSPELVAARLREIWQIPVGPIRNLVSLLEDAGIVLIPSNFGVRDLDALAQFTPGLPPVIFYNREAPTDRLRFTLAHELGHLVMHRQLPSENMETEADAFAAEFMAPTRDIAPHFTGLVTLATVAALKPVWRLSMAVLLRSARRAKKLSASRYEALWREMAQRGWRLREPPEMDIAPEEPTIYRDLLTAHLDELGYSVDDLGRLFTVYSTELREAYLLERPRLRLVRADGGDTKRWGT